MSSSSNSVNINSRRSKLLEWGKLITITGSAQALVQGIGLISGILLVRILPTKEYALYTLVNTMLGTMTILADGGIASGVMAQGGKVWKDPESLGTVIVSGMNLRKKFAIGSLLVAVPVLVYMLLHHGASMLMTGLITLSLIPAFISALSDSLLEVAPKLRQDIKPLQKNQVSVNTFRLVLLLAVIFIFPYAYIAILATGIPRIWGNFKLQKISSKYANLQRKPDDEVTQQLLTVVKKILPGAIYYCISGQVTIWLISIFGSTKSLAEVGALGRLSMVLTLFNTVFFTLLVPRFARLPDDKKTLTKWFFSVQGILIMVSLVIIGGVYFFPSNVLWVLGGKFKNLTFEVVLIAIGGCASMISSCTNQMLSSRGIIVPPVIFITAMILVQVLLAFAVHLDQVSGVLLYGIFTSIAIYTIRVIYLFYTYI